MLVFSNSQKRVLVLGLNTAESTITMTAASCIFGYRKVKEIYSDGYLRLVIV